MLKPITLPYEKDALSPHVSEKTLDFHYEKHYKGYLDNLNKLIPGTVYEGVSLEEVVKQSSGPIFNNAAQAWNHEFYFRCMAKPRVSEEINSPSEHLLKHIEQKWDSLEALKKDFEAVASRLFGSGWVWLVWDSFDQEIDILNMHNADNPLSDDTYLNRPDYDYVPLMVMDVWEHAYYLDTQNDRKEYINNFWSVINWNFVSEQFENIKMD